MKAARLLFIFFICFFCEIVCFSQTIISAGAVSGTWTKAASPYVVNGDISIPVDQTLTVEPGTSVLFTGYYKLMVNGKLLARGTQADSIVFDRNAVNSPWHSIRIENVSPGNDSTIFEYCRIAHTEYPGGDVTINGGNAISVKNFHKVRISHCLIRNNKGGRGAGVYITNANIKINNNTIRNNSTVQYGGGICVEGGSPIIKSNRIERNAADTGGGIFLTESGSQVEYNIISYNNSYWTAGGMILANHSNGTLFRNVISYNESGHDDGGGISIAESSPRIINNTIAFNKADQGEGVLITGNSRPDFKNTIIYSNRDSYANENANDEIYVDGSNSIPNFYNCNIQAGITGIVLRVGTYSGVAKNNLTSRPQFRGPATNDLSLTWSNSPSMDSTRSRCIDAGTMDSPHDPDGSPADIGSVYFNQNVGLFPPRVDFEADSLIGFNSLTVSFTDRSDKGNSTISEWHWSFGDGATSIEQHPVHQYNTEGTFQVSLTIKDTNGFFKTLTRRRYIRLFAGTYVKGIVSGTFSAQRYIVGGDLLVNEANTLNVSPGVEFVFIGPYKLEVRGALKAKGTALQPITFTYDTTGLDLGYSSVWSSANGGWRGIYVYASGPQDSTVIDHCKVQLVQNNGLGAIYAFSNNGAAGMRISNSDISYNTTQGIYVFATKLVIRNNFIHHNYASMYQRGAGIYFYAGSPLVINNIISYNQATDEGGGMCVDWDSRPSLINNVITNNRASRAGGICDYAGWIELINNTIAFNTSTGSLGGGYFLLYAGDVTFTNNIITNNTPAQVEVADPYSRVGFRNTILEGGSAGVKGYQTIFLYDNMLTADPKLMTAANGFGRLQSGSPALNAGIVSGITTLPAFDVVGNARITNSQIDIGAFEYGSDPPLSVLHPLADVNKEEDFDPFVIPLESVFGYPYGVGFLTYRVGNPPLPGFLNAVIKNNALYVSARPDLFGDHTITVFASNGVSEVGTSFVVHIAPVDDPPMFTIEGHVTVPEDFHGPRLYPINVVIPFGEQNQSRVFALQPSDADFVNVEFSPSGSLSFSPKPDLFGSKWFLLTMTEGQQAYSTSFSFSVLPVNDGVITIAESNPEALPRIFPNPATDHIMVRAHANSRIVMYNINGQMVLEETTGSTEVSLQLKQLNPGLYLLSVEDDKGRHVFRVLKQ